MSIIFDQGQAPWDDGTSNSPTKTMFGDMDIIANKNAGKSYSDMLAWYEANPSQQGGGGIGGGVHQKLVAGANAEKAGQNNNNYGGGGGGYTPPTPGGTVGREGFRKAYGEEFQENLAEATKAYDQDESKMGNLGGTSHDFRRGVKQEQAIKDNDPFNDSWDSRDFYGKYMTMFREGQKGRGDGTSIANKYIFNAAKTNPVNIQALDQQIRTNPLYSEAKAELSKLNTFGDLYKNKNKNQSWMNPQAPSVYEPPDLQGISSDYMDKIDDIKL
jgi:hypothetical protein